MKKRSENLGTSDLLTIFIDLLVGSKHLFDILSEINPFCLQNNVYYFKLNFNFS